MNPSVPIHIGYEGREGTLRSKNGLEELLSLFNIKIICVFFKLTLQIIVWRIVF